MLWLPQLNATFNKEKGNPARKMAALAWEMYNISTLINWCGVDKLVWC